MIKRYGYMRGRSFRLVQFANDWISADAPNGQPVIVKPDCMRIESENELQQFLDAKHTGFFWMMWTIDSECNIVSSGR